MGLSVRKLILAVLNAFWPLRCLSCRKGLPHDSSHPLCAACRDRVLSMPDPVCAVCGTHLPDGGEHCRRCRKEDFAFSAVRSFGPYDGPLRDLIRRFKYGGKDRLARTLAGLLKSAWDSYPEIRSAEVLAYVPLHHAAERERGYNQSRLLAKELAELLPGMPLADGAVRKVRNTASQTRLTREERAENLSSAFAVEDAGPFKGKNVLIVDDVCTTGSTLNELAKTLRRAGARRVFGLTLARD